MYLSRQWPQQPAPPLVAPRLVLFQAPLCHCAIRSSLKIQLGVLLGLLVFLVFLLSRLFHRLLLREEVGDALWVQLRLQLLLGFRRGCKNANVRLASRKV